MSNQFKNNQPFPLDGFTDDELFLEMRRRANLRDEAKQEEEKVRMARQRTSDMLARLVHDGFVKQYKVNPPDNNGDFTVVVRVLR